MAILAYLISWVKPRQNRQDEQQQPSRSLSNFMGKKKRKMSDLDKIEEDDHQRAIMIRKSLQSRASSRATDRARDEFSPDQYNDSEEEERNPGLKSDWKAYEADLQRNRSTLIRSHPGVDRAAARTHGGPSSRRPQPYSYGSSSTNPRSPTLSSTPESPVSPGIGRAF
ncbi:hypothetical protein ACJ41O_002572 [Fusarium nematophilum]